MNILLTVNKYYICTYVHMPYTYIHNTYIHTVCMLTAIINAVTAAVSGDVSMKDLLK